jgi:ribosomal protein S18 acetylase RimI-like enzyme
MTTPLPVSLTSSDLDASVRIQSAAFQDDPLWVYLLPEPKRRAAALRRCFNPVFATSIRAGQVYGAGTPLAGVAIWSLPDSTTPLRAALPSIPGFLKIALSPFVIRFRLAFPIFAKFDEFKQRYVRGPHYYLNTVSVAPEAQGQGLASKLIRPFLAEADQGNLPAYTETMTPSNVGLYTHYGFKVMEEYRFPGTDLYLWSFLRA